MLGHYSADRGGLRRPGAIDFAVQQPDELEAKVGEILRHARAYDVAVHHHGFIDPDGAGVDQIIANPDGRRQSSTAYDAGADENPGPVTDRRDHLSRAVHVAHELECVLIATDLVRRP